MTDRDPPPTPPVATIDEAIASMRAIDSALPLSDGLACFNRMYLQVTEDVSAKVTAGEFGDSAFITELDVVFANLYFAAVDAVARGGTVPVAWRPLAESRGDARIEPIQFALAGMNAHINHDLPMAVVETCEALGTKPDAGSHHSDYQEIDPLLDAAEQKIREAFEPAEIASADRHAAVLNLIADWGIKGARDVAWESAVALWEVRHIKPAYDTLAAALAEASALASRALLVVV